MDISAWNEWVKIGASLAAVVAGVLTYLVRKKKKTKQKTKDIISPILDFPEEFWSVHTSIQETITELRIMVDCARTQLVQFHNGGTFLDGISMKKMSLTHESLERSIAGESEDNQDMMMSMFMPFLKFIKDDDARIQYVSNMEECHAKHALESANIIAFSVLPIKKDNLIVGYICAQWCRWEKVDNVDEEIVIDWLNRSQSLIEVELINQRRKMKHK